LQLQHLRLLAGVRREQKKENADYVMCVSRYGMAEDEPPHFFFCTTTTTTILQVLKIQVLLLLLF
jgi:hypothetical protein